MWPLYRTSDSHLKSAAQLLSGVVCWIFLALQSLSFSLQIAFNCGSRSSCVGGRSGVIHAAASLIPLWDRLIRQEAEAPAAQPPTSLTLPQPTRAPTLVHSLRVGGHRAAVCQVRLASLPACCAQSEELTWTSWCGDFKSCVQQHNLAVLFHCDIIFTLSFSFSFRSSPFVVPTKGNWS